MLGAAKSLSSASCCRLLGVRSAKPESPRYERRDVGSASHAETARRYFPLLPSQRVQIGEEIVELLRREGVADGRHHVAAGENCLTKKSLIGGQPAGKKLLFEKALQARAVLSRDGVRVVAGRAVLLI